MRAYYNGSVIAFKKKKDSEWQYCPAPRWNWGVCDYKIIDLEFDDYIW